jgi:hypothetical protein
MTSLASMSSIHYRYISHADGIIFLLDPLQIPSIQSRLSAMNLPALDPHAAPEDLVMRLQGLFKKEGKLHAKQKVKVPIAFTLSKIDTLQPLLEPGSALERPALHMGFLDLDEVQSVSTEIASYLREWISPNFCTIINDGFTHYSYFGVSSLGEAPDKNNRIHVVSPLRVEDPFLWIIYNLGLIKGKKVR